MNNTSKQAVNIDMVITSTNCKILEVGMLAKVFLTMIYKIIAVSNTNITLVK
jgi:hypothetical protein